MGKCQCFLKYFERPRGGRSFFVQAIIVGPSCLKERSSEWSAKRTKKRSTEWAEERTPEERAKEREPESETEREQIGFSLRLLLVNPWLVIRLCRVTPRVLLNLRIARVVKIRVCVLRSARPFFLRAGNRRTHVQNLLGILVAHHSLCRRPPKGTCHT